MAHDLFLGKTKRNVARDSEALALDPSLPMSDEVTVTFSEDEKAMLEKISILRMKADLGDKAAKKQLVAFTKNVAKLKARAAKGDTKAKRNLLVLRESGIFNTPQQITMLGLSLFSRKEDEHGRQRRMENFETEVSKVSSPDQISDAARMVAFNPEYRKWLESFASQGSSNASKILAASKQYQAGFPVAMKGSSEDQIIQIKTKLRQLKQKSPQTDADRQTIEQLTERLTRIEAMSGIGAWNPMSRAARRSRRAHKLANLKARAASGDAQAIARLQQMQQRLSLPNQTATTTPTTPPSYIAPPVAPTSYSQPASYPSYQPPYVPPYYQDADGNYYQTQPQPGQGQPTIDVFVGQRSRRRAEEAAAEMEDRGIIGWYGNSFVGGSIVGNAIPHDNYRVAVMKAAVKSANGRRPTTKDYFAAKSAVDKVIGKSGITIYMPGAKPGRRTI